MAQPLKAHLRAYDTIFAAILLMLLMSPRSRHAFSSLRFSPARFCRFLHDAAEFALRFTAAVYFRSMLYDATRLIFATPLPLSRCSRER